MNEEHGYVDLAHVEREFTIGDRVHVIPNHICVAVNLHEQCTASARYGGRGVEGGRPREAAVRRAEDQDPPSTDEFFTCYPGHRRGLCGMRPLVQLPTNLEFNVTPGRCRQSYTLSPG